MGNNEHLPDFYKQRRRESYIFLPLGSGYYLLFFKVPGDNNIFVASVDYIPFEDPERYLTDCAVTTYVRCIRVADDGKVPGKDGATPLEVRMNSEHQIFFPPNLNAPSVLQPNVDGLSHGDDEKLSMLGVRLEQNSTEVEL